MAEKLVPIARLLQMETLLQVCDQTIADSLAFTMSWDRNVSWGRWNASEGWYEGRVSSVGKEDHRWLEFGMKYDLPSVMAVALSSAMKKVVGRERDVGEHVVLEFLQTPTPAVKGVLLEEMVAYTTAKNRDLYRPNMKELTKKLAAACGKSA